MEETYFGSPWSRDSQEYITVIIRPPQGTPLEEIDKIVQNYEKIVQPYAHAFTYYQAERCRNILRCLTMQFAVDPDFLFESAPYYFFGEAMLAARTGNVATSVSGFGDGIYYKFGGLLCLYHRFTGLCV